MHITKTLSAALILLLPQFARGQQASKKHYSIFSPAPRDGLREMETDRPDVTKSAITVDAGHFQYESDLVAFEREQSETSLQKTAAINRANLKVGLTGVCHSIYYRRQWPWHRIYPATRSSYYVIAITKHDYYR